MIGFLGVLLSLFLGVLFGAFPGLLSQVAHAKTKVVDPPDAAQPCDVEVNLRPGQTDVLLGRFEDEPYVVAVPGRDRRRLAALRICVPDALILPSRRGPYIHVASFKHRATAENLNRHLHQLGFDARVTYFQR
jgi:hypothetical protein